MVCKKCFNHKPVTEEVSSWEFFFFVDSGKTITCYNLLLSKTKKNKTTRVVSIAPL